MKAVLTMEREVSNTNILILFTEKNIFYFKHLPYICITTRQV